MMGSGKSTIGRRLADRLGWTYLDSDEVVERETGRTVEEIWKADGEAAFRVHETRVLAEALSSPEPAVVSAAGGVVLQPENRQRLRANGPVVWLRARVETLAGRVRGGEGRPLLAGDPEGALRRLLEERGPYYEEVADVVVDVDDLEPAAVVERVLEAVKVTG
jgi:shikimate kinase